MQRVLPFPASAKSKRSKECELDCSESENIVLEPEPEPEPAEPEPEPEPAEVEVEPEPAEVEVEPAEVEVEPAEVEVEPEPAEVEVEPEPAVEPELEPTSDSEHMAEPARAAAETNSTSNVQQGCPKELGVHMTSAGYIAGLLESGSGPHRTLVHGIHVSDRCPHKYEYFCNGKNHHSGQSCITLLLNTCTLAERLATGTE